MRTAPLTPGELARIPEFIEHWTRIGLSTTPVEHPQAERALCRLYTAAGLAEPAVVWASCPMTAMLSAIVYTAIRATGREAEVRNERALAAIVDRIIRYALIAIIPASAHRRIGSAVEAVVASALRLGASNDSGFDAVFAINDARRAALDRRLAAALAPALQKRLRALLLEPIRLGPVWGLRAILESALNAVEQGVVGIRARLAGWAYFGAPLWVAYAAEMDYLNRVLGIRLDRSFIDAVADCGLFWMLNGISFAAERPTHLNRDGAGDLHCEVGPSIAYPSGWSWWHWHDIRVPQEVIEMPETITLEAIHHARSPELRRIMIERYRMGDRVHGVAAYLRDADARRLDRDRRFGTLWHLDTAEAAPTLMVEVANHTPEPDGTCRHFWLRVDPDLRPILEDGGFGAPQAVTARNAVASTFGLSGAEYAPDVET
jgi:hypothetical protein